MQGKKWRTPEHERQVIELYLQLHSVPKVAEMVDCGMTTIQNILNDNGIKQDGRRGRRKKPNKVRAEPKVKKSHCRSKYCPALIVMLHNAFGWDAKQIAEATGYGCSGARTVLVKRGLVEQQHRVNKSDFDLDQIEREYLDGATTYELGKKYGVNPATISTWMCERGICLGKGAHQSGANKPELQERHKRAKAEFAKRLHDEFSGRFEYVGGFRENGKRFATVRCTECGTEFQHYIGFQGVEWTCPSCIEAERKEQECKREQMLAQERDARRYERMFAEIREYSLDKTCAECGSTFHSVSPTAKYCSKGCSRKSHDTSSDFRHYYHVKYGDAYRKYYDPSVTLKELYERDNGVCQICGEPCDWNDKEWGNFGPTYPSIDHIVPRAQGGNHFWSNVQLAHCMCNSRKRDLSDEVAKSEVVTVAQAS
jgi:5-methylcytosine-specific restriction endonuclease McrA/transposase